MSWFGEQIKTRIKNDEDSFNNAFIKLSSVVMSKSKINLMLNNSTSQNAIEEIARYYKADLKDFPENFEYEDKDIEYLFDSLGLMQRKINLDKAWYKTGMGALLGNTLDGELIALIPAKISGYEFFDYEKNKKIKVDKNTYKLLGSEAICFYKQFPSKPLTLKDLLYHVLSSLSKFDLISVLLATLIMTLQGLFIPAINKLIFSNVIISREISLLFSIIFLMFGITVSRLLINIIQSLFVARIQVKIGVSVQSATMARIINLPTDFFKKYNSGELVNRCELVSTLCDIFISNIFMTVVSMVFASVYILQIINYTPILFIPSIIIASASILSSFLSIFMKIKFSRKYMEISAKLSGMVMSFFSGIQKIKLSGSERRVFSKWANNYAELENAKYNQPVFYKIQPILTPIIWSIGNIFIYYFASNSSIDVSDYIAFNVAFGMLMGSITSFDSVSNSLVNLKPIMEMVAPILEAVPETSKQKTIVKRISGSIEFSNISFRYNENMPMVLDNFSLKINSGQYVAIVGQTGCGKSTILRMLLGFETPKKGAVYFDGKDIEKLDLKSLRKNIGVVMQNGKIFQGDIFNNIIISSAWTTMEGAWEAAEFAGLADDIRKMPMGMRTMVAEGIGLSGGQKQRLMIARAIVTKPKILLLDEATSALDSITQKKVSDSLSKLKCTRIVVAHRLSTIKNCDRIIVLDKGNIVEDGNYETLNKKNGYFTELIKREMLKNEL